MNVSSEQKLPFPFAKRHGVLITAINFQTDLYCS